MRLRYDSGGASALVRCRHSAFSIRILILLSLSAAACESLRPEFRSLPRPAPRLRFIAGNSRITVPCVQFTSSRRARHSLTTGVPSTASSMPIMTPATRTSRTMSHSSASASNRALEQFAKLLGVFEQPFLLDHFQRGDSGAGGDRIAAKCRGVHAGPQRRRDFGLGQSARRRQCRRTRPWPASSHRA